MNQPQQKIQPQSQVRIHLLAIDPQLDFIDTPGNLGSLAVVGAYGDMQRLAQFIERVGPKLDDIHVTLDTHRTFDVAHPSWWKDVNGNPPAPFTMIASKDLESQNGAPPAWRPFDSSQQMVQRMKAYVQSLEKSGRYPLVVWPEHCLIGSPGHCIQPDLLAAVRRWEKSAIADVDYVTKGSNPYTEHYSAVKAEVPDPNDPSTQLNTGLIKTLQDADLIIIAGEALSHCVANTVRDIADNFGAENVKKMVLLRDCSSNVTGFEKMGDDFVAEMTKRGMKVEDSKTYLQ